VRHRWRFSRAEPVSVRHPPRARWLPAHAGSGRSVARTAITGGLGRVAALPAHVLASSTSPSRGQKLSWSWPLSGLLPRSWQ
jgi:hypothetical protein